MRENPLPGNDTYDKGNDNFVRSTGDARKLAEMQLYQFEAYDRGQARRCTALGGGGGGLATRARPRPLASLTPLPAVARSAHLWELAELAHERRPHDARGHEPAV